jgi:hypothetical protein
METFPGVARPNVGAVPGNLTGCGGAKTPLEREQRTRLERCRAALVRAQLIRQVQQRASQPCRSPGDREKTILPYVLKGYRSTSNR